MSRQFLDSQGGKHDKHVNASEQPEYLLSKPQLEALLGNALPGEALPGAGHAASMAEQPRREFLRAAAVAAGALALAACNADGLVNSVTNASPSMSPNGAASGVTDALTKVSLSTRLTREFGIDVPFVGAGMGFIALPALVAAVSNAGGLGVLGNAIEPPAGTQVLIRSIKALTSKPFGVDFIVDDAAFGPLTTDAHIDVCVDERVKLVVFHFNVPPKVWVDRLHASGAKVWMQAASVKQAVEAVEVGVDAIVAQGSEAGGHNKSKTPSLTLLPQIINAVKPVMVLAAGGIANGEGVFNALVAGAEGVWVGTRLVASTEAYANSEYKQRLVQAQANATVTTTMFGPEFPNRPYRVLRNRIVNEFAGREDQIPTPPPPPDVIGKTLLFPQSLKAPYEMPKFSAIVPTPDTVGDFEEMGLPAGDGVKFIKDIQPAAKIIASMMGEARQMIVQQLGRV
ncbi:MAG: nitronate monooxygenase [Gemmatimonas sp.]